jgi:oxazoline/thiazoline synthase
MPIYGRYPHLDTQSPRRRHKCRAAPAGPGVPLMLLKPKLKEQYRSFLADGGGLFLLSHQRDHVLPATLYEHMVPLLDGQTSTDELVEYFQTRWGPADIWCALWHLERQGCVVEATSVPPLAAQQEPTRDFANLSATRRRIAVSALGDIAEDACVAALQRRGFVVDDTAELGLILTDSYLRPDLASVNLDALHTGRAWLLAKPTPPVVWVGPLFRPGVGCCYRCVEDRLRRNHPFEYHLLRNPDAARALLPADKAAPSISVALKALVTELVAYVEYIGGDDRTEAIVTVDTSERCRELHQVVRRPQCAVCGDVSIYSRQVSAPIRLQSRRKQFVDGGASRMASAKENLVSYERLVDPLCGVIHDVERLRPKDQAPLHVYVARYGTDPANGQRTLHDLRLRRSSGKGRDEVDARTSTLGEAIERYSGIFQGDEPRVLASMEELGQAAIEPNRCMQFSEAQYAARQDLNRCSTLGWVPRPLETRTHLEWTPVWSMTHEEHRYLPTMFLYDGYPVDREEACCVADPSGSAAGNSLEEAVLQGLMELVERDSLALWWYNRIIRPQVDLESLRDPYCMTLAEQYRSQGREFWVLDITSDLGIPSFAAVSRRIASASERIVFGFGAHLDAHVALTRALEEMDQVLACITAEPDAMLGDAVSRWLSESTLLNQPYLTPGPSRSNLEDMPNLATDDVTQDLKICQQLLEQNGMELMVLDQTRPDINVPVVKVIVPGLRHFRARFAPGRLYTAPVGAGWLSQPSQEHELNPIEFFL